MSLDPTAVREGDELPPLQLTPDIDHVRKYFANSRNSPPFFFDEAAAKAQGLPGRLVPGPLKVGFLYGAVENWLGGAGYVRAVRAAHRRPDVQGNPIVVTGSVARVYDEDGRRRADLELMIINHEGQPSVRGFATVEFWQ
jgi:acyl dehydratase